MAEHMMSKKQLAKNPEVGKKEITPDGKTFDEVMSCVMVWQPEVVSSDIYKMLLDKIIDEARGLVEIVLSPEDVIKDRLDNYGHDKGMIRA